MTAIDTARLASGHRGANLRWHDGRASFDKLRMKSVSCGTKTRGPKKSLHAELVEARTVLIQASDDRA